MNRRIVLAVASVFALLLLWTPPASAFDPYIDPTLIDLGTATPKTLDAGKCVYVAYRDENVGRARLQYRGPDGTYHYAEWTSDGIYDAGTIKFCTKTTWAKGNYWLRSVMLDCERGTYVNTYYDRAARTVRDCYGDVQSSGLGLDKADFAIR